MSTPVSSPSGATHIKPLVRSAAREPVWVIHGGLARDQIHGRCLAQTTSRSSCESTAVNAHDTVQVDQSRCALLTDPKPLWLVSFAFERDARPSGAATTAAAP